MKQKTSKRDAKGRTGKSGAIAVFLALAMLLALSVPAVASADLAENGGRADPAGGEIIRHAVYLGVQDYGAVSDQAPGLGNFLHRFSADGQVRAYPVSTGEDEGYAPPVKGAPGVRTVKGFLSNAASGVGTALYIYGGGWVWQDETIQGSEQWSNPQTRTIGVPQTWIDFFQRQDETFVYRSDDDPAHDYYSARNNYNQYGYAGGDPAAKKHRLSQERRCFYRVSARFRGGQ